MNGCRPVLLSQVGRNWPLIIRKADYVKLEKFMESKKRSLKVSYVLNALLTAANLGFPTFTLWFGAHTLGPQQLGKYQFAGSLASQFLVIAGLGLPLYGAREIARRVGKTERLSSLFGEIFVLNTLFTFIAAALYYSLLLVLPNLRMEGLGYWLGGMVLANFLYADFLPQGRLDYIPLLTRSLIPKILAIAALLLWVKGKEDLLLFTVIIVSSVVLQNGIGFWHGKKDLEFPASLSQAIVHLRPLFWISLSVIVANLYLNLDTFLVGLQASTESVAWYATSMRGIRIFTFALASLGTVFLASNSILISAGDHVGTHRQALTSLRITVLISVPVFIICLLWAESFILAIFGEAFRPCVLTLRIVSPMLMLSSLNQALGTQLLFPAGKEKKLFLTALVASLFGVGLNLSLTPKYAHIGAACATMTAETISFLCILYHAREYRILFGPILKTMGMVGVAAAVSFILPFWLLRYFQVDPGFPLVLLVISGGFALEVMMLFAFKETLTKEFVERYFLKR